MELFFKTGVNIAFNHEIFGRKMTDEQTLVMYSGHPMGLFPSHKEAPRVVLLTEWLSQIIRNQTIKKMNALGVSAIQTNDGWKLYVYWSSRDCSWKTITVLNGFRKIKKSPKRRIIQNWIGGMSGAQPKAGKYCRLCYRLCRSKSKITHSPFTRMD